MKIKLKNLIVSCITCCALMTNLPGLAQGNEPQSSIFPKGNLGPETNFTGKAWAAGLVENDTVYNTVVANVTFEAGARTNWHSHPSGQLMLVIDGEGYHQIKGQPKQVIRKGDVAKCPPDTIHWHGASRESSMTHVVVLPNTERGIVEWMTPVTDQEYSN